VKIVITGGAGFLGRKLAEKILARGALAGARGRDEAVDELVLFDRAPPLPMAQDKRLRFVAGDIADGAVLRDVVARASSVFHFAAVVSGEAEADTDKGMSVNLDGTRALLEACRAEGIPPRVIFASSLAVYGGALPDIVSDDIALRPTTSYGAQKAIGELLVNDYSRKGFIDGRSLRFPTIIIRPGRPNRAASTFASSIFRDPLAGRDAVCPVSPETTMAVMSPRRLVAALETLHDMPAERFGTGSLQLPAISVSVAEMIAALARCDGKAAARIRFAPDPAIQKIVEGWPRALEASRARALGIAPDADIDEIVESFISDDLPAQRALLEA
jgi:D-erythronate 2-dehydrogenase